MKTLCFDFGNTRLKVAVFENDVFTEEIVLPNDEIFTIERLLTIYKPQKTILSSVINHNPGLENFLAKETTFHKIEHSLELKDVKKKESTVIDKTDGLLKNDQKKMKNDVFKRQKSRSDVFI